MQKPRLVYAGHSHHVKTGSTVFLQDLLATRFHVTRIADESWLPDGPPLTAAAINAARPDIVVFFQLIPKRRELRRLIARNVVWIPMHDGVAYGSSRYWRYRGSAAKTLHFSRRTETFFRDLGYETHHVQYFPEPAEPVALPERPSLFFWARRKELSWPMLKALLGPFRPERIVLRHSPDPGQAPPDLPDADDAREYGVEIHDGWMEAAAYRDLRRSCQIFLQPRLHEGIGQAMLEALASGQAVIAPDAPTMNEYIRDGFNGWLYDPASPRPLDFTHWRALAQQAHRESVAGARRWSLEQQALLDFVERPPRRAESLAWRLARRIGK